MYKIDAHYTSRFIDYLLDRVSHKYCRVPGDIFDLISNTKLHKFYITVGDSYASSFEYVDYKEIMFGLFARKNSPKKLTIRGVDGYLAEASPNAPKFSLFAQDWRGRERIMLSPASFVNHSCKPNAKYVCGGPRRKAMLSASK